MAKHGFLAKHCYSDAQLKLLNIKALFCFDENNTGRQLLPKVVENSCWRQTINQSCRKQFFKRCRTHFNLLTARKNLSGDKHNRSCQLHMKKGVHEVGKLSSLQSTLQAKYLKRYSVCTFALVSSILSKPFLNFAAASPNSLRFSESKLHEMMYVWLKSKYK